MKSILELSEVEARRYFMESSNYCSLELPKYIDFSKVLAYVEDKVGKKSLNTILKETKINLQIMKASIINYLSRKMRSSLIAQLILPIRIYITY